MLLGFPEVGATGDEEADDLDTSKMIQDMNRNNICSFITIFEYLFNDARAICIYFGHSRVLIMILFFGC